MQLTTTGEIRQTLYAQIQAHGGKRRPHGWEIPVPTGHLILDCSVRGRVTTWFAMDRILAQRLPHDGEAAAWLKSRIHPYVYRWCQRTRSGSSLPSGGTYSSCRVLTAEAPDALALWLPQEIQWQQYQEGQTG